MHTTTMLGPRPRPWTDSEDTSLAWLKFTLPRRRVLSVLASSFSSHCFIFSVAVTSILAAKVVHIYSHISAIQTSDLHRWGLSFFAQDTLVILLIRLLVDSDVLNASRRIRVPAKIVSTFLVVWVTTLSAINTTFFLVTGSEVPWRNVGFAGDASSRALLLTGLATFVVVECGMLAIAWLFQGFIYDGYGVATDALKWPWRQLRNKSPRDSSEMKYTSIEDDWDENSDGDDGMRRTVDEESSGVSTSSSRKRRWCTQTFVRVWVLCCIFAQFILLAVRPHERSLIFLSWTSAMLPFLDFISAAPTLEGLEPVFENGVNHQWVNVTALRQTKPLAWLSQDPKIPGFQDWYDGRPHYSPEADPLKISNLDSDVLPMLRDSLKNIDLRHIMIIGLESTRKDVFPLKKNEFIWNRLAESYAPGPLPEEALKRLATLTRTANYLTGEYDDGFEHKPDEQRRRGGINFRNAYTTATYTLKAIVGIFCGLSPLVADFNQEQHYPSYQPCLANILDAMNKVKSTEDSSGFRSYEWVSRFMQSVTLNFDSMDQMLLSTGIPKDNMIDSAYLRSDEAKLGRVDLPDINYFGMAEEPLEKYIRDAFSTAQENNQRVFLSHMTSTTHHAFGMPAEEPYVELANGKHEDLSHYLNAVGYDDRWLGKIMQMLDEEGVANSTLLVVVGDHGQTMPEDDRVSTYYNPTVFNSHVPLVISHPQLPAINVDDPVSATQILPTILDLLLETKSVADFQAPAMRDLLHLYEGQSMLRTQKQATESGRGHWQFVTVNPGGAMIAVRDGREANLRLVVPVIENVEWQFTDLASDPKEVNPVRNFDFASLVAEVQSRFDQHAAEWVEEAAFVTRWWVQENRRRWRYGAFDEKKKDAGKTR